MGSTVLISSDDVQKYGELGIRYNALRDFYKCIANVVNKGGEMKSCT